MEKDTTPVMQTENAVAADAARIPYTAPELLVYNHARITAGGVTSKGLDFTGGGTTSYKVS